MQIWADSIIMIAAEQCKSYKHLLQECISDTNLAGYRETLK